MCSTLIIIIIDSPLFVILADTENEFEKPAKLQKCVQHRFGALF